MELEDKRAVVVGGSRGLGLGIVEALVAHKVRVTVVARDRARLAEVASALGVTTIAGDAAEPELAASVLRETRPEILILSNGLAPRMAPIHEQTWEDFSAVWNSDVKASFHWVQEALRLPLARGSRVLLMSSGAAMAGSPLSGGYAGAKRMQWLLAGYASGAAAELDRDLRVQAILPRQIIGETDLGRKAAAGYASKKGVTVEQFLAAFGKPLPPRQVGEHVVTILTDAAYERGTAFELRGDTGIRSLDA